MSEPLDPVESVSDQTVNPDPAEWKETPDLATFLPLYRGDDNIWWRIACGHHQNLFEEACDLLDSRDKEVEELKVLLFEFADAWELLYTNWPEEGERPGIYWKSLIDRLNQLQAQAETALEKVGE